MLLLGFLSAVSLAHVPLSLFALLVQLTPLVTTLLGVLFLKDSFLYLAESPCWLVLSELFLLLEK